MEHLFCTQNVLLRVKEYILLRNLNWVFYIICLNLLSFIPNVNIKVLMVLLQHFLA